MARRPDRTAFFKSLQVPVLVLHGDQDKFISSERARQLAAGLAQARFVQIPHAGHATPLEAPAVVAGELTELVKLCFAREK
jgi:pimeloyl-ACP methyl ester carboxylesterase